MCKSGTRNRSGEKKDLCVEIPWEGEGEKMGGVKIGGKITYASIKKVCRGK